jgi:2-methylcitrate dehydratase PrpD
MPTIAEQIATWLATTETQVVPKDVASTARRLVVDVAGLCVAARREDYVAATLSAVERGGACTVIGHAGSADAAGAALVNGTAAHGEDYDDTFEGGPVHSGAVIVPAVLAACEREGVGGERVLVGLSTGVELMCRLSLVAPMATHNAGFHPTAVFGALAAAGGVGAALGLSASQLASALGIAGSMASGIIEYLAEGTWTKRMHAGWAAQSGVRSALMARGGFIGPRTVFEGVHGVYRAFAPSVPPNFEPLVGGLGQRWVSTTVAFKPYACGTMTQPFVDCAIRLAESGVTADQVAEIECEAAAGTLPRLWEPLSSKHRPPTPYAAKFSTPFCMAVGFFDRKAGLAQFTPDRTRDRDVLQLASKIRYKIDPANEYPRRFTGHLRATLVDGRQVEFRQACMRGGADAPLDDTELEAKFRENATHGGWSEASAERLLQASRRLFTEPTLAILSEFRG